MHDTILLHGGGPERPQTAAADRESCMKEKHHIRLRSHHSGAAVRLAFRRRKLQKAVVPLFLMIVMMTAAACGKEEVLTLRSSPSSSEGMEARRTEEASGDSRQQGCDAGDAAERTGAAEPAEEERDDAAESGKRELLYVYVCGAVECPGVYAFEEGARVFDAIEAAGGLSADADGACVNQALKLSDQDQLYIRTLEEKEQNTQKGEASCTGTSPEGSASGNGYGLLPAEGSAGAENAADARININTASQRELTSLPGIGDTKAAAILADRTENGFYEAPEDLKRVSGIGDATFEKLKDRITTGNP